MKETKIMWDVVKMFFYLRGYLQQPRLKIKKLLSIELNALTSIRYAHQAAVWD